MIKIAASSSNDKIYGTVALALTCMRTQIHIRMYRMPDNKSVIDYCLYHPGIDIAVLCVPGSGDTDFRAAASRIKVSAPECLIIYISEGGAVMPDILRAEPFAYVADWNNRIELIGAFWSAVSRLDMAWRGKVYKYKHQREIKAVPLDDIMYLRSDDKVISIVKTDGGHETHRGRLDDVDELISRQTTRFIRVSKSYLVNLKYVQGRCEDSIVMQDGETIRPSKNQGLIRGFT